MKGSNFSIASRGKVTLLASPRSFEKRVVSMTTTPVSNDKVKVAPLPTPFLQILIGTQGAGAL